jgi:tetratricopeptide (TPR) repeat protein
VISLDAAIVAYRAALDDLRAGETAGATTRTMRVLLARDAVVQALAGPATAEELAELAELDGQLQAAAPAIEHAVGRGTLARWRDAVGPQPAAWWWALDQIAAATEPRPSIGWAILAAFFLTLSISFAAEISQRFLAGQPDFFGLFSTVTQATLALLAGGALTQAGGRWIEGLFTARGIGHLHHWKAVLAFLLLAGVLAFRLSLPAFARVYNDSGVRQQEAGRITSAIGSYARAISLRPDFALAHYNLGSAYEDVLQYDKALVEYQTAIQADPQIYLAYNNLARLYLLQKRDYVSALQLANRGLDLKPAETSVQYSLYKNRAWADLGLKLPGLAEADLRQALALHPEGAAAHCLLAQVLELKGKTEDALPSWEKCVAYYEPGESVEPDWYATARERVSE